MPSSFDVKKVFRYQDGELYWLEHRRGVVDLDRPAGSISSLGYRVVFVDGKQYRMHRLIWFYFNGWTEDELDHINRTKSDNRIENLRVVSRAQNLWNRAPFKQTKGVHKKKNRWCASIQKSRKRVHLGYFSTQAEAIKAYDLAATELHGEYACLNSPM